MSVIQAHGALPWTLLTGPIGYHDDATAALRPSFFPLTAVLLLRHLGRVGCRMCASERRMRYLFEDYALDTARRELRRGPVLVPLEPKVFDLLVYLIDNRDRVVSKNDLLSAVWEGLI